MLYTSPDPRLSGFDISEIMRHSIRVAIFAIALQIPAGVHGADERASPPSPETTLGADREAWLQRMETLRAPTPRPEESVEPEDFSDIHEYREAQQRVWGPFWVKERARLWELSELQFAFLERFPDADEGPALRREATVLAMRCLSDDGEIGSGAMDRITRILEDPDLSAADALPIYSHQLNMIGILAGVNYTLLVEVPRSSEDVIDSIDELLGMFAERYPDSAELGTLHLASASYVERRDRALALDHLERAEELIRAESLLERIGGQRFRLQAVGQPLPRLEFEALDGRSVDTDELRGKVVLLDFWATWCGPCIKKLPELLELHQAYSEHGLVVIGISLDTDRDALESFLEEEELPWAQHFDGKGSESPAVDRFGVRAIPSLWIIDKKGVIAAVDPADPGEAVRGLLGIEVAARKTFPPPSEPGEMRTMRIRVEDEEGNGIRDAGVRHSVWTKEPFEANQSFLTDAQGEVEFEYPASSHIVRVWASKESRVPMFVNFDERTQQGEAIPEEFVFRLKPGTVIGGRVLNEQGAPVEGARVEVNYRSELPWKQEGPKATINGWLAYGSGARVTDQEGRWTLDKVPDDREPPLAFKISHPDYIDDTDRNANDDPHVFTIEELRDQTAVFTLRRGPQLEGVILGPDGQPIVGALVVWAEDPYSQRGSQETRSVEGGRFKLPPLPPRSVPLTIVAEGFAPQLKVVELKADEAPRPVRFELESGGTTRFEFVDGEGQPIPRVSVSVRKWRKMRSLYTHVHSNVLPSKIPRRADDQGVYVWSWAPEDEVHYRFYKKGYEQTEVMDAEGDALISRGKFAPGSYRVVMSEAGRNGDR